MTLINASLNAEVIVVVIDSVAIGMYSLPFPPTSIPLFPAFSPSVINPVVYVVFKHHVYIKTELVEPTVQNSLYSGSWVRKFVIATSVTVFLFWSVAGRLLQ